MFTCLDAAPLLSIHRFFLQTSLPFNRSSPEFRQGSNGVTSFLDASTIYGTDQIRLEQELRDRGNRGKMKLVYSNTPDGRFGYPPKGNINICGFPNLISETMVTYFFINYRCKWRLYFRIRTKTKCKSVYAYDLYCIP